MFFMYKCIQKQPKSMNQTTNAVYFTNSIFRSRSIRESSLFKRLLYFPTHPTFPCQLLPSNTSHISLKLNGISGRPKIKMYEPQQTSLELLIKNSNPFPHPKKEQIKNPFVFHTTCTCLRNQGIGKIDSIFLYKLGNVELAIFQLLV